MKNEPSDLSLSKDGKEVYLDNLQLIKTIGKTVRSKYLSRRYKKEKNCEKEKYKNECGGREKVALLVINENASLPPKESIGNDKGRSTSKCKAITPTDRETIQLQKPSQSSYSEPELLYLTSDTVIWPRLCSPVEMLSA
ncbi:hypothetical protein HZH68_002238 [Vespula germanica]|uniref:Uncharacterized protein n=1 Tax=Vespula germanica TaxID=30212 RepID=A0A834NM30_VESGE|nr:hypothetical protein HZH68_002238 [Vespula germanica]